MLGGFELERFGNVQAQVFARSATAALSEAGTMAREGQFKESKPIIFHKLDGGFEEFVVFWGDYVGGFDFAKVFLQRFLQTVGGAGGQNLVWMQGLLELGKAAVQDGGDVVSCGLEVFGKPRSMA